MIRIAAIYRNEPGSRFDADYYVGRHMPFARSLLDPFGLSGLTVSFGTAALDGAPPPYWAVAELLFPDRDSFDRAMAASGEALFADIRNYTDATPELFVSRYGNPTGA